MSKKTKDLSINPEDHALFQQAMKGTRPLTQKNSAPLPHTAKPLKPLQKIIKREPVQDNLSDHQRHDPVKATDYLQFSRTGLQHRVTRKLRQGQFPIQATLDLHGFNSEQAKQALLRFINNCTQQGFNFVIVIHGKGRGINDAHPVLKNKIHNWLQQMPEVLAYNSARPQHGGLGAVYVLLKKI